MPEPISVVIPAYNEERVIEKTLLSVGRFVRERGLTAEIIVVDDGSEDQTIARVRRFPGVRVVRHLTNHGKGRAVRTGYAQARHSVVVAMDADNSLPIDNLERVFPLLETYDIVVASRYLSGELKKASALRRMVSRIFSFSVRHLFGIGVSDTQCGFKVFKKPQCDAVFECAEIDGWAYDVEVLALAERFRLRVGEFPVRFVPEERPSRIANVWRAGLKMGWEVARLKLRLMRRKCRKTPRK